MREEVVGGLDLGKGEGVCHELAEREALRGDDAHQPPHALLAARAERRDDRVFAEARRERFEGYGEVPRIDAQARNRASGAYDAQAILERLLLPERLDRDVDAAAREPFDLGDDVLLLEIE